MNHPHVSGSQRRLLVPMYVHPAVGPDAWRALLRAADRLYGVVLNSANGPGPRPDPELRVAARQLREKGVPLLGYVDTDYGRRQRRAVLRDVARHRRWYGTDGVFFDQTPAGGALLPRYARLARAARLLGARTVVLNPGTPPDPGYAEIADCVVTFEGTWQTYRPAGAVPPWAQDGAGSPPAHRTGVSCHLVYGVPQGHGAEVSLLAGDRGATVHCAVPGEGANPWQHAPLGV